MDGCGLGLEPRRDNSIILLSHGASYFLDDTSYMNRCIGEVGKAGLFSSGQVLAPHGTFLGAPSLPERSGGPARAEAGLSPDELPKRSEGPARRRAETSGAWGDAEMLVLSLSNKSQNCGL